MVYWEGADIQSLSANHITSGGHEKKPTELPPNRTSKEPVFSVKYSLDIGEFLMPR